MAFRTANGGTMLARERSVLRQICIGVALVVASPATVMGVQGTQIDKTGYVSGLTVIKNAEPHQGQDRVYFEVDLVEDAASPGDPTTFILTRDVPSSVDDLIPTDDYLAVSYSTVEAVMISLLKDAAIHQWKVRLSGRQFQLGPTLPARNFLDAVSLVPGAD